MWQREATPDQLLQLLRRTICSMVGDAGNDAKIGDNSILSLASTIADS